MTEQPTLFPDEGNIRQAKPPGEMSVQIATVPAEESEVLKRLEQTPPTEQDRRVGKASLQAIRSNILGK